MPRHRSQAAKRDRAPKIRGRFPKNADAFLDVSGHPIVHPAVFSTADRYYMDGDVDPTVPYHRATFRPAGTLVDLAQDRQTFNPNTQAAATLAMIAASPRTSGRYRPPSALDFQYSREPYSQSRHTSWRFPAYDTRPTHRAAGTITRAMRRNVARKASVRDASARAMVKSLPADLRRKVYSAAGLVKGSSGRIGLHEMGLQRRVKTRATRRAPARKR